MIATPRLLSVAMGIGSLIVAGALQAAPAGEPNAPTVPPCVTGTPCPGAVPGVGPQGRLVPPCVTGTPCPGAGPQGRGVPPCVAGTPGFHPRHHHGFRGGPGQFQGPRALPPRQTLEDRLTYLRGAIKPTDAQVPQWTKYEEAITVAHSVKKLPSLGPEATVQEKIEARAALKKAEAEALENLAKARAELVKVLTPEQIFVLEKMENRAHHSGKIHKPINRHPRIGSEQPANPAKL